MEPDDQTPVVAAAPTAVASKSVEEILVEQARGEFDWDKVARQWLENDISGTSDFISKSVEIVLFQDRGRGLRAKQKIEKGSLILVEKAIANEALTTTTPDGVELPPGPPFVEIVLAKARESAAARKMLLNLLQAPASTELDAKMLGDLIRTHAWSLHHTAVYNAAKKQSALFHRGSMLNHSCEPNCVPVFFGPVMVVFAAYDIPSKAEVTVPYVDVCLHFDARRQQLERWGFECKCTRCEREEREGNRMVASQLIDAYKTQVDRFVQRLSVNESEVKGLKEKASASKDCKFLVPLCLTLLAGSAQRRGEFDVSLSHWREYAVVSSDPNRVVNAVVAAHNLIDVGSRVAEEVEDDFLKPARQWLSVVIGNDVLVELVYRQIRFTYYRNRAQ